MRARPGGHREIDMRTSEESREEIPLELVREFVYGLAHGAQNYG